MWRKIHILYNNSKFRTKLLVIFVFTSLLPILVILMISVRLNSRNMADKVNQLMVTNLTQIAERMNLTLEVYTNMLYQIYQDEQVTDNVKVLLDGGGSGGYAVAYNKINNRLKQYYTTEAGIRCISVICSDGSTVVYDFETASSVDNLWKNYQDLRQILPYQEAVDQPGMVITPTMAFDDRGGKAHYFHISKRVFDLDDLERGSIATIVISIDEKVLNNICNTVKRDDSDTGINFVMDKEDTVISYPDADFSGIRKNPELTAAEFVNVSGFMKNLNMAINIYEDPVTGWLFYNAYDKDLMLSDVVRAQRVYAFWHLSQPRFPYWAWSGRSISPSAM